MGHSLQDRSKTPSSGKEPMAAIWTVPSPHGGTVLTLSTKLIENGLLLLQFLLLGIVCLLPLPIGIAIADGLFPKQVVAVIPVCAALVLSLVLIFGVFVQQLIKDPWSSRYLYYKTRREFLNRPDPLVDPNHPEAILVEVIPRKNWTRIMLEDAADIGFLFMDRANRQLLFEGDRERYRIPIQALLANGLELMNKNCEIHHRTLPLTLALISFRAEDGVREIPLRPLRTVSGDTLGNNYLDRASELDWRIQSLLCDPDGGDECFSTT